MADLDLLRRAADRAAGNPFYLASVLLRVAEAERLDDEALARRLGCDPTSLASLLLCRRPGADPHAFRADVVRIAERFGADPLQLAEAIRLGDSLASLAAAEAERDFLAAARDREESEEDAE